MTKTLSKRAEKALEILKSGGKFRYALETDSYTGAEKFKYRLLSASGGTVKGYGHATFYELESRLSVLNGGTSVSTYYGLSAVHTTATPNAEF